MEEDRTVELVGQNLGRNCNKLIKMTQISINTIEWCATRRLHQVISFGTLSKTKIGKLVNALLVLRAAA